MLRYTFLTLILVVVGGASVSAQTGLDKVIAQGQSYEDQGDYQRAKYYYGLVNRLAKGKQHFSTEYQELSTENIARQDSLLAYESKDDEIRRHMHRFDSLAICCSAVWQIVELERVIEINQALVHPKLKVDQLWIENPGITKQVRILQSKVKREAFISRFKNEKKKLSDGKKLEGYFGLKSLVSETHPNEELDKELLKLENELSKEIAEYEKYMRSADSLFAENQLTLAKAKFKSALGLNSECYSCMEQIEFIDVMSELEIWTNVTYVERLQEARSASYTGELSGSKRIYQYILKNVPEDSTATIELKLVEEKIQEKQSARQIEFGINLQEERANAHFSKGEYVAALKLYSELKGNYASYVSDIELIEKRISVCEKKIKD
jgi:hypothetical protein